MWGDLEGNSCLHVAASNGHAACVEKICQWAQGIEDLCVVNKKGFTAAHVASSADALKALYENGADLWIPDPKNRYPLFILSFFGRMDCVAFVVEMSVTTKRVDRSRNKDVQGDTALHAACLCGHAQCVQLLLYHLQNDPNSQGLRPHQLAERAGHGHIAALVLHVQEQLTQGFSPEAVFGCSFEHFAAVLLYYGCRWTKMYDPDSDSVYFYDRATFASQWDRPATFDESPKDEAKGDIARNLLKKLFHQYDAARLVGINDILSSHKGRLTDLFISLANQYQVEDLSMFAGIDLD